MKKLKINFTDFYPEPEFSKQDNIFTHLLSKQYEVEISENPDLLIYSNYGKEFQKYSCTRIFFTVENLRPNYHECDYSFAFDIDDSDKHFRFPSYCFYGTPYPSYGNPERLTRPRNVGQILKEKKKFCCFVVSNPYNPVRNKFFRELSKYKKVDSGGKFFNNLGYNITSKAEFIKDYKFNIAFENESWPGYTTEKIFEPMMLDVIPVYWGNPYIGKEFNTKSFINCHDYRKFDQAIEQMIRIDKDDDLYASYLIEPFFINNSLPEAIRHETVLKKLISIVENMENRRPVAVSVINYKYIRNTTDFLIQLCVRFIPLSFKKTYMPYYRRVVSFPGNSIRTARRVWKKIFGIKTREAYN